jgi:hypothetical protein
MNDYKQNEDRKAATLNDPLTESGSLAFASPLASTSLKHKPRDLLDHYVRQIKTQMIADQIYDRIRLGQSEQHLLLHTLQALNTDCVSTFLRQLSKRIEQGAK